MVAMAKTAQAQTPQGLTAKRPKTPRKTLLRPPGRNRTVAVAILP